MLGSARLSLTWVGGRNTSMSKTATSITKHQHCKVCLPFCQRVAAATWYSLKSKERRLQQISNGLPAARRPLVNFASNLQLHYLILITKSFGLSKKITKFNFSRFPTAFQERSRCSTFIPSSLNGQIEEKPGTWVHPWAKCLMSPHSISTEWNIVPSKIQCAALAE